MLTKRHAFSAGYTTHVFLAALTLVLATYARASVFWPVWFGWGPCVSLLLPQRVRFTNAAINPVARVVLRDTQVLRQLGT